METNFNINPWYDDFDKTKGFHRILFNPTFAVQARELTQLQTMLQNQIEQFGSHIFKHGSMVLPGNSEAELMVPCVKIQSTYNLSSVNIASFENKIVVGQTTGIRAYVKKAVNLTQTDPITFYLSYLSGGVNSELTFIDNEILTVEGAPSIACLTATINSNSVGSLAFIKAGVFYVNGHFVYCHPQIEVISKYSTKPSAHVLLKIVEETVNSSADESLLDPAQGSYNFAAPGADRFKMSLVLTTIPFGDVIADNYIEIMRFEDGVMTEHVRSPKYNELEKSLATRTFDESGDYIVDGFDVKIREHKKTRTNSGVYDTGDSDKFVYNVSSGKAYFKGYPIEKISGSLIEANKARTLEHVKQTSVTIKPKYGQHFFIASTVGSVDIFNRELIELYDISSTTGGLNIGYAKVLSIDYHTGDGVNPIYKLSLSDISLVGGTFEDIGSVRSASGTFFAKVTSEYDVPLNSGSYVINEVVSHVSSGRTATVSFYNQFTGKLYAHRHSTQPTPKVGDQLNGTSTDVIIKAKNVVVSNGQTSLLFSLPNTATKSIKDATNAFDLEYTHHISLVIPEGSTTTPTVSGTLIPIETGTFIAFTSSGTDSIANYSLNGTGTTIIRSSPAPVGGVSIYAQVNVSGATPRTKSITSYSTTKTSNRYVMLDHADVSSIVSVIANGVETINMWNLDTGATDSEYGISSIRLKNGFTLPSGQLTISYKYFFHTPGDFFTVDSYAGMSNDEIPTYVSVSNGKAYSLRDFIDFRKTYYSPSNIVVSDTILTTSAQKYIGRIDSLCVTKDSKIKLLSGVPAEQPKAPVVPVDMYELYRFTITPYTYSLDSITEKKVAVQRYTMKDIQEIDDRVSVLEVFSTISSSESKLLSTPIIDEETGVARFKSGFVVESMDDPFGLASITSDGFSASLNSELGIYPRVEMDVIPLTLWNANSGGYRITNGVLTMNYTEVPLAEVGVSSRITNLNPFMVVAWNGELVLSPSGDIWVDVIDNPEVTTTETVVNWVQLPAVIPTPVILITDPAPEPETIFAPVTPAPVVVTPPPVIPTPVVVTPPPVPVVVTPEPPPAPPPEPPVVISPVVVDTTTPTNEWIYGSGGAAFHIPTGVGVTTTGQTFSRSAIQASAATHIAQGGSVQQMVAVAAQGGFSLEQAEQILGISLPLFQAPLTTVPAALLPGAVPVVITSPINAEPITVPPVISNVQVAESTGIAPVAQTTGATANTLMDAFRDAGLIK